MGTTASKAKARNRQQADERQPQPFFTLDPSVEVRVVSRLTAISLLAQEATTGESQDKGGKKKKKKARREKEPPKATQAPKWAVVEKKLTDKAASSSPASSLALLPPELLCEVLSFLDYQSLLVFRQTCAWGYGLVRQHHSVLVFGKLVNHIFEKYNSRFGDLLETLKAINKNSDGSNGNEKPGIQIAKGQQDDELSSSAGSADDEEVRLRKGSKGKSDSEDGGDGGGCNEDENGEKASSDEEKRDMTSSRASAATAARLLLTDALEERGMWLRMPDHVMFEDVFDPHVSDVNMKAFASIRSFSIPKAFYAFGENLAEAVAEGLRGAEVNLMFNADMWQSDAWSYSELAFGPELVPLTSVEELDQMLQGLKEVNLHRMTVPLRSPTAHEALQVLAQLVGSCELLLWKDSQFKGRGYCGHRLVVVGGSRAAVVQWEYYSNACGGPYATYSCGMG